MATIKDDLSRLRSWLNTSGLQTSNNPLYQVINQLIDKVKKIEDALAAEITDVSGELSTRTYVTSSDERTILPNSKQLTAGDHIVLDVSQPGKIIINSIQFDTTDITNTLIIELFRYAFRRLDMIEELLGIDRDSNDIIVPVNELEIIQDDEGDIGTRSMK